MSYTNGLDKPSDYFNTKLYTGTGSSGEKAITGVGFQPDWLWIKNRTVAQEHWLADSVRGTTKFLESNSTNAESSDGATGLASFDSDGFTLGTGSDRTNDLNESMVAWCWLGGGTASSNTDGSITSSVSANQTAGFSIVSYTGTASNATVGHGLGVAPACFITKSRVNAENWGFYHQSLGNGKQLELNTIAAQKTSSAYYNNTSPTSTVFSIGTADSTNDNQNMIAYCFAEKKGYSKFSSYSGNGNANGNFNYLGFLPSLIILKGNNTENWSMYDNKRLGYNVDNNVLYPNATSTEGNSDDIDFLSNGFKIRRQTGLLNDSGVEYIYMAFAENPFVTSTGIPTTAR
tara:strand:- start:55 stop:1092 length:1038 start_codon:yes stop_codon:yes gene_type:complete